MALGHRSDEESCRRGDPAPAFLLTVHGNFGSDAVERRSRTHTVSDMNIRRVALVFIASVITASCSEKSDVDRSKDSQPETERTERAAPAKEGQTNQSDQATVKAENEPQPAEDEIAEDCVAFLRATKVGPAQPASGDCVGCSAEGTEVLAFQQMQMNRISCSATACEVAVTIRASFNPGSGETIGGGLTAWIPAEQRSEYLRGHTPPGEQAYRVKIIYKRTGNAWRAIEFDKANPE